MKTIAILQHHRHDGPAYFATYLQRVGIPWQVYLLDQGERPPTRLDAHRGLCVLGGPMSANDKLPYQAAELACIQAALAAGVPVIGHCLGGQLMAKALGGTVSRAPVTEIGWSDLVLLPPESGHWFGPATTARLFQWHGETFSIPPGACLIAEGHHCRNQAFVWGGKHLAMQFHCEVDEAKIRLWLEKDRQELLGSPSPAVQSAESLLATLAADVAASQQMADTLYAAWLQGLGAD